MENETSQTSMVGWSSYLCAPETKCYCPASTVADFLGKEAGAWVVLKNEVMLASVDP